MLCLRMYFPLMTTLHCVPDSILCYKWIRKLVFAFRKKDFKCFFFFNNLVDKYLENFWFRMKTRRASRSVITLAMKQATQPNWKIKINIKQPFMKMSREQNPLLTNSIIFKVIRAMAERILFCFVYAWSIYLCYFNILMSLLM